MIAVRLMNISFSAARGIGKLLLLGQAALRQEISGQILTSHKI